MKEKIGEKFIELLKVKSLITIMTFAVFSYLSVIGKIDAKDFMIVLGMISTYYFTKQDRQVSK